jgi:hypothetical protein
MVESTTQLHLNYLEAKAEVYDLRDALRAVQLALFKEKQTVHQLVHVMYRCGLDPNKVMDLYDSLELVQGTPRFVPPDHFTELPWLVRKRFAFDGWQHMVPSDLSRAEMDLKGKRSAGLGPGNFARFRPGTDPVPPLPALPARLSHPASP